MSGFARTSGAAPKAALPFLRREHGSQPGVAGGVLGIAPRRAAVRRRRNPQASIGMLGSILLFFFPAADPCAQERIGRLFSSLEQRIDLDRMRDDPEPGPDSGNQAEPFADPTGPEPEPEPRSRSASARPALAVTINGVLLRSDGHQVAWVNGVETVAGTRASAGVRVEAQRTAGEGLRIRLPEGGTRAALKPGQTIDAKGRVRDVYERRPTNATSGMPDDRAGDSNAGETGEGATGPRAGPEPPSLAAAPVLPTLPPRLMQELLWRMQAGSAPPGTAAPDVPSASAPPGTAAPDVPSASSPPVRLHRASRRHGGG